MLDADKPADLDTSNLSYKFERLREKLRQAIASGELSGKLPGERALSKQFHVNAKTLSKALTDLAAEGLLDRSIGRGTYVKGSTPDASTTGRWLVVCDPNQQDCEIINHLREFKADIDLVTDVTSLRPSFLNQFSAVIDLSKNTPDAFIRDLVVRNVAVVAVGKEPKTFSTHAIVFDQNLAAAKMGRQLLSHGHRKLAAIEPAQCTVVAKSLRRTALSLDNDATIDAGFAPDAVSMLEHGVTGFVCQSVDLATQVREVLERAGVRIPEEASITAIGATSDDQPASGYFMRWADKAKAIVDLLQDRTVTRPTTIWLAGKCVDRGTVANAPSRSHLKHAGSNGVAETMAR